MRLNISKTLPLSIAMIAFISLVLSTSINVVNFSNESVLAAKRKLEALVDSKKNGLEIYLESIDQDLNILANSNYVKDALIEMTSAYSKLEGDKVKYLQDLYINDNPNPLGKKDKFDFANDGSLYSMLHREYHPWFRNFLHEKGYYDIFLVDAEGNLVYTVFKEHDYATNLLKGQWKDTDLANAFLAAKNNPSKNDQYFFDFKPYEPSYNAPASFISQAILDDQNRFIGAVLFQMPVDRINNLMKDNVGLGETGHTYLVGDDFLMRSESRLLQGVILKQQVRTDSVVNALKGLSGSDIILDYSSRKAVSAYNLVNFKNSKWAIIAEQQEQEVLKPIKRTMYFSIFVTLIIIFFVIIISVCLGSYISKPIVDITRVMAKIAANNLDLEVPHKNRSDEVGQMAVAVEIFKNNALEKIKLEEEQKKAEEQANIEKKKVMKELADNFEKNILSVINLVASSADELKINAETTGKNIEYVYENVQQATNYSTDASLNVNNVAQALDEMVSSVKEINIQISKSTAAVGESVDQADNSRVSAESLDKATQEISDVIDMINEIAEQINLLALNATIESARAGEAGKGFAVVASEVKNLATQTSKAINTISSKITDMQNVSKNVSDSLKAIRLSIDKVNEYSTGISAAVEEQSISSNQIASSMQVAAHGTKKVTENVQEISQISEQTKLYSNNMVVSSQNLSSETEKLKKTVREFLEKIRE